MALKLSGSLKHLKQIEAPFQGRASLKETADSIVHTLEKLQNTEQRSSREKQNVLSQIEREEAGITQKL